MVKYNLELGKDFATFSPSLEDKFPDMVDVDKSGRILKKIAKQKAIFVYVDSDNNEVEATGKAIVRDGQVITLNKVQNLKAANMNKVSKDEMFKYAFVGEHKIFKTSLDLKEDEAVTFLFAVSKGYLNTVRGFIYRVGDCYWLAKTTLATKAKLSESMVVVKEEVTEQKPTMSVNDMLSTLGVEA